MPSHPGIKPLVEQDRSDLVAQGESMLYFDAGKGVGNIFYFALLHELLGTKFRGFLPKSDWTVDLRMPLEGTLNLNWRPIRADLTSGTAQGWITKKRQSYPGIITNRYGKGKSYTLTFDPTSNLKGQEQKVEQMLRSIVGDLRPEPTEQIKPESLVSIKLTIKNVGTRVARLRAEDEAPLGFIPVEAPEATISGRKITWEMTLQPGETVELTYFLVSAKKVDLYDLITRLSYYSGAEIRSLEEIKLGCKVTR